MPELTLKPDGLTVSQLGRYFGANDAARHYGAALLPYPDRKPIAPMGRQFTPAELATVVQDNGARGTAYLREWTLAELLATQAEQIQLMGDETRAEICDACALWAMATNRPGFAPVRGFGFEEYVIGWVGWVRDNREHVAAFKRRL